MQPGVEHSGLIDALKRLRERFVLRLLRRRLRCYHSDVGVVVCQDISEALVPHIEALSSRGSCGRATQQTAAASTKAAAVENASVHSPVPKMKTGLSRHLRRRRSGRALEPHLAERLKQSTHDHIHTALRLAQQGDLRTARLHAEIANNAQKEAAFYMSEEDYQLFTSAIRQRLDGLLK